VLPGEHDGAGDLLRPLVRTFTRRDVSETAAYVLLSLGVAFAGSLAAVLLVPLVQPGQALSFGGRLFDTRRSVEMQAAIFAAAMVRFTFIALAGSLFVATIMTESGKRWHVAAVGFAMFLAVIVGLSARYNTAKLYAAYVVEQTAETRAGSSEMPSCGLTVNTRNSIAIRQALARDAIFLIPTAGLFGTGLDSFMRFSCIKAHQVHISILQAAVEFGWLGGGFLVLLIAAALYRIYPLAKNDGAVRFVLCSLVFVVLLSLAHGRTSRDGALFALIGCAVGVSDLRRRYVQ